LNEIGRLPIYRPKSLLSLPWMMEELARALMAEESAELDRDQHYWLPLRAELEKLRLAR